MRHSTYIKNKARAIYTNSDPSLTDQSQARDSDINVIVGRFIRTGTAPGAAQQGMYGDFSELPYDLREFLETARGLDVHKSKLPEALRDLPVEQLLALTPQELKNKLTPPAPTPADKPAQTPDDKGGNK